MQLRVVWYLRLIGDTEGPALITSTAWHYNILLFCLLGTPTTTLKSTANSERKASLYWQ